MISKGEDASKRVATYRSLGLLSGSGGGDGLGSGFGSNGLSDGGGDGGLFSGHYCLLDESSTLR